MSYLELSTQVYYIGSHTYIFHDVICEYTGSCTHNDITSNVRVHTNLHGGHMCIQRGGSGSASLPRRMEDV